MATRPTSEYPTILGSNGVIRRRSVLAMEHRTHHSPAGEGLELTAPDAVLTVKVDAAHTDGTYEVFEVSAPRGPATPQHRTGWGKSYYVLLGRMIVQVDDRAFDVGPGAVVVIPPGALHTFTVLTPTVAFLVVSAGRAMGAFHADLSATVPQGRPLDEVLPELRQVLSRHAVSFEAGVPR